MTAARMVAELNAQIAHEFAAHQQYLAVAVHYDALTMPQTAGFFYRQALEEREHALMMVRYLIDTDAEVTMPGVATPVPSFEDVVSPVRLALEQERRVTEQVFGLVRSAREEGDIATEQFLQWFVKEQVEEVATMNDLLAVVERNRERLQDVEDFVAREHGGGGGEDAAAPPVAGA